MQFVSMDDVASAVAEALEGAITVGSDLDLSADETLTLAQAVAVHRRWLGLPEARVLNVPAAIAGGTSLVADLLGRLGWRSPLRSTAMLVARGGVTGDLAVPRRGVATLAETLAAHPAGVQDLWFARLYLMKPLVFGTLAAFWIASGVIALAGWSAAAGQLVSAGFPAPAAAVLTLVTSVADILIGLCTIVTALRVRGAEMHDRALGCLPPDGHRPDAATVARAARPLVKVLPSIVLALVALAIFEER